MIGVIIDYRFLPGPAESSRFIPHRGCDGFEDQLNYIANILQSSSPGDLFNHPLTLVHTVRYFVSVPFLIADDYLGPAGPLILMCVAIAPLVFAFSAEPSNGFYGLLWYGRLLVLGALLVLSGRNILVAIGMGYLVVSILKFRNPFLGMTIGSMMTVLSSGSALIAIVVHFRQFIVRRQWYFSSGMVFVSILLGVLFLPPVSVKIYGFATNAKGYVNEQSTVNEVVTGKKKVTSHSECVTINDPNQAPDESIDVETKELNAAIKSEPQSAYTKIVSRVLYRSTIATSYLFGQKLRLAVYLTMLALVLLTFLDDLRRKQIHPLTSIILICSLGFLFEGAGVWTILFPLMWRVTWLETNIFRVGKAN